MFVGSVNLNQVIRDVFTRLNSNGASNFSFVVNELYLEKCFDNV